MLFRVGSLWLVAAFALSACADDIAPTSQEPVDDAGTGSASLITNIDNGDGSTTTTVDASDTESWVYLNLATGSEVTVESPASDDSWDLAFRREKIMSNGGVSGSGGVEIARVAPGDFEGMLAAPSGGYETDQDDTDDTDVDPDYVFLGPTPWYDYDFASHTLSPADYVYAIRSVEGAYYKLEMLDYYNEPGDGGYPQFRWAPVEAPSGDGPGPPVPTDELVVDASVKEEWVYVDLQDKMVVEVSDPESSLSWDLAFSRTQLRTNGGSSGDGLGGALEAPGVTWEDLTASPTVGFVADESVSLPGPPGSGESSGNPVLGDWYNYDPSTHAVSPKDTLFLVRTADGKYAKVQFLNYDDGVTTIRSGSVSREAAVWSQEIDASDAEAFVYLRFDLGEVVSPESPSEDLGWDLAVSRTKLQTNSGTSGSGGGGALDVEATSLDDIASVPVGDGCYLAAEGHICDCDLTADDCAAKPGIWTPQCGCPAPFTADEMLPLPGPPGSGEYSGNPVLAQWYDYDPVSHVTSPKAVAYVVRTALGDLAKVQVTNYADGVMTIDWAYAGPEETSF